MALQGSFSGTTDNDRITPTIHWRAVQSVEENASRITVTLTYRRDDDYETYGIWNGTLTIGGQTFSGRKNLRITDKEDAVAISATVRLVHDEQGNLTVTVSATGAIAGTTLTGTVLSGQIVPDPIARTSAVSCVNGSIGSRCTLVVNRKSTQFTHSIGYRFGTLTGYIDREGNPVTQETKFADTTVNFLVPESFYGQIPREKSGVCTLTCQTYAGNTRIGEPVTATFTVTADPQLCCPLLEADAQDSNDFAVTRTGDNKKFIRYVSEANCTAVATPRNGAVITQLKINGTDVTDTGCLKIANIAKEQVVVQATDSRGYTTTKTLSLALIPYILHTVHATARRTEPTSGDVVLTMQGFCWTGNFGSKQNVLGYRYTVNGSETVVSGALTVGQDHVYREQITLTGLDYTRAHTIQLQVYDQIRTVTREITVHRGIPVFDWGEKDFQFHVPVSGDFQGTLQGVTMRTTTLWDGKQDIRLQSKWTDWDTVNGEGSRQSVFLFGCDDNVILCGVVAMRRSGNAQWQGSGDVTVTAGTAGQFTVTLPRGAYDRFTLLSAEPFDVL